MNNKSRNAEQPALGSGATSGPDARKIVPAPGLSTEGKPSWWADVLTGRVRRDWASMDQNPRDGLWARR